MWIFGMYGNSITNSDRVSNFIVESDDFYCTNDYLNFGLFADDVKIGAFSTGDEAKKELKQIYDALIAGQESYSVG